jgi:hypothetical protein
MSTTIPDDHTLARLRALPRSKQAIDSVTRIRARSHAALAAAQRRERPNGRFTGRLIDGALALIGAAYLSGAAAQAWRLFSAIR